LLLTPAVPSIFRRATALRSCRGERIIADLASRTLECIPANGKPRLSAPPLSIDRHSDRSSTKYLARARLTVIARSSGLGTIKTDSTLVSFRTRTVACGVIGLEYDPVCPFRPAYSAGTLARVRVHPRSAPRYRGSARRRALELADSRKTDSSRSRTNSCDSPVAARASNETRPPSPLPENRAGLFSAERYTRAHSPHNRFATVEAYHYDVAVAAALTHACRACSRDFYAKRAAPLSHTEPTHGRRARCVFVSFRRRDARAIPHDEVSGQTTHPFGYTRVCMHIRRTRDAREYVSSLNEAYGRDINARCTRWRLRDCRRTVRHCEPTGCSLIKHTDYVINYSQFNRELR